MSDRPTSGLDCFFNPRSIAVIGASPKPGKVGRVIFENLLASKAHVFPVNPSHDEVLGVKCYPSVLDIEEEIDLAVVAIPAPAVPMVLDQCGKKGVKGVVIISGGFSEIGEEGARREEVVKEIARKYGVRVIGPNCLGVYDGFSGIDTFFLPRDRLARPKTSGICFISQSGAYAGAIMDWAAAEGFGIGRAVSYGNAADVNECDLIEYFSKDESVKVIVLYIEKVSDGRRFIEVAREAVKQKPIVVQKAGRGELGARAARSHTGALASPYEIYSAAFRQAGIVEVRSLEEMFDVARALERQPPAEGNKLLIVTNGGGAGVTATDAAEALGFDMPPPPREVLKELKRKFPPHYSFGNPIDLTGDACAEDYEEVLRKLVLETDFYDVAVVIALYPPPRMDARVADVIATINSESKIPIVACSVGGEYTKQIVRRLEERGVPVYPTPERAIRAAWALAHYGMLRKKVARASLA